MKICPVCHNKEMDDNVLFCSECGFSFKPKGKNMMFSPSSLDDTAIDANYKKHMKGYDLEDANPVKGDHISFRESRKRVRENPSTSPHDYPGEDLDKPRRPVWPIISGILAIMIIVGVAAFFYISNSKKEKKEQAEIDQNFSAIETIYKREKEYYLDDALKDWQGQKFYDQAKEERDNDSTTREQKITALETIKDDFQTYDDGLAKGQEETLNKSFNEVKGKYEKEFLIEGEQEKLDKHEEDYDKYIEDRKFKSAQKEVEDYSQLEKNIMSEDEDAANYSAKAILFEEEFMPQTIDFSVDADTYTNDGKEMSISHFTLIEQIGEDGEKQYVKDLMVSEMELDGGEAKYQLTFSPGKPENYSKNRLYILHVRNQEGTKGFTASQGTNPEKLIQKAASDYLKDFINAFNQDCHENSRSFKAMTDYLENGSQAYSDYAGLPTLDTVYHEMITDVKNTEIAVKDKGDHIKITADFYYYIVRRKDRSAIMDNDTEEGYYWDGENRNFSEEVFEEEEYIIYTKDKGNTYQAQDVSSDCRFKVFENLSENNTFELRIRDNHLVGPIYKHSNGSTNVTSVKAMEYIEDTGKTIYTEDDLYPAEEEEDNDVDADVEDDGDFSDSDEEYNDGSGY